MDVLLPDRRVTVANAEGARVGTWSIVVVDGDRLVAAPIDADARVGRVTLAVGSSIGLTHSLPDEGAALQGRATVLDRGTADDPLITVRLESGFDLVDRRRWPRGPVEAAAWMAVLDGNRLLVVEGRTQDLSAGGAALRAARELPLGEELPAGVALPDGTRVAATARVLGCRPLGEGWWATHLRFTEVAQDGRADLDRNARSGSTDGEPVAVDVGPPAPTLRDPVRVHEPVSGDLPGLLLSWNGDQVDVTPAAVALTPPSGLACRTHADLDLRHGSLVWVVLATPAGRVVSLGAVERVGPGGEVVVGPIGSGEPEPGMASSEP